MIILKFNMQSTHVISLILCGFSILLSLFLAIRTYITFDKITISNEKYHHIISNVNQQRVLSQRAVLLSEIFLETNDTQDLKNLQLTLYHMKEDYKFLLENNLSKELMIIYTEKPFYLTNDLETFFSAIENIEKTNTLYSIKELSSVLFVKLDYLIYKICEESNENLKKLNLERYTLLCGFIIIVFLQFFIIFTLYQNTKQVFQKERDKT